MIPNTDFMPLGCCTYTEVVSLMDKVFDRKSKTCKKLKEYLMHFVNVMYYRQSKYIVVGKKLREKWAKYVYWVKSTLIPAYAVINKKSTVLVTESMMKARYNIDSYKAGMEYLAELDETSWMKDVDKTKVVKDEEGLLKKARRQAKRKAQAATWDKVQATLNMESMPIKAELSGPKVYNFKLEDGTVIKKNFRLIKDDAELEKVKNQMSKKCKKYYLSCLKEIAESPDTVEYVNYGTAEYQLFRCGDIFLLIGKIKEMYQDPFVAINIIEKNVSIRGKKPEPYQSSGEECPDIVIPYTVKEVDEAKLQYLKNFKKEAKEHMEYWESEYSRLLEKQLQVYEIHSSDIRFYHQSKANIREIYNGLKTGPKEYLWEKERRSDSMSKAFRNAERRKGLSTNREVTKIVKAAKHDRQNVKKTDKFRMNHEEMLDMRILRLTSTYKSYNYYFHPGETPRSSHKKVDMKSERIHYCDPAMIRRSLLEKGYVNNSSIVGHLTKRQREELKSINLKELGLI